MNKYAIIVEIFKLYKWLGNYFKERGHSTKYLGNTSRVVSINASTHCSLEVRAGPSNASILCRGRLVASDLHPLYHYSTEHDLCMSKLSTCYIGPQNAWASRN